MLDGSDINPRYPFPLLLSLDYFAFKFHYFRVDVIRISFGSCKSRGIFLLQKLVNIFLRFCKLLLVNEIVIEISHELSERVELIDILICWQTIVLM